MGLRTGSWKTVTIAKDANPAVSAETDLGSEFRSVQVYAPALNSATITVESSRLTGDTAVQGYVFDSDAAGDYVNTTTARTTAGMDVFKDICARYVTILLGATQTTALRTLYVRGIDPI
jgi:hypothetical protein